MPSRMRAAVAAAPMTWLASVRIPSRCLPTVKSDGKRNGGKKSAAISHAPITTSAEMKGSLRRRMCLDRPGRRAPLAQPRVDGRLVDVLHQVAALQAGRINGLDALRDAPGRHDVQAEPRVVFDQPANRLG